MLITHEQLCTAARMTEDHEPDEVIVIGEQIREGVPTGAILLPTEDGHVVVDEDGEVIEDTRY